jgi:hypothetical protein
MSIIWCFNREYHDKQEMYGHQCVMCNHPDAIYGSCELARYFQKCPELYNV